MNKELRLQVGGTLNPRQHVYIEREEDESLFLLLLDGEYVNVMTSRQMGKSSLMMRMVRRLEERSIRWVTIDLASELGSPSDLTAYYLGLLGKILRSLRIELDLRTWWDQHNAETINQRLLRFFREVIGDAFSEPVVIFLDEIDSTLKLPYTDDLFTAIRGMYNERAIVDVYRRISFCLLGVATPNELIKNRRTTAYNVGISLELRDFDSNVDSLSPLVAALNQPAALSERLLDRILYWTGGHPYLTHKFCAEVADNHIDDVGAVDKLITRTFDNLGQSSNDVHFQQILRFLEERLSDEAATIELYRRVLAGERVLDRTTLAHAELKLSGLVKRDSNGNLTVRNPIYHRLFDTSWVESTRPIRALSRARRYGLAASIAFLLFTGAGITYYTLVLHPGQERLSILDQLAKLDISITQVEGNSGVRIAFPMTTTQALLDRSIPLLKSVGTVTEIIVPSSLDAATTGNTIHDLSPIAEFVHLRRLELAGRRVTDIAPLAVLSELRILRLGPQSIEPGEKANYPLVDVAPLASLKSLEELSLFDTSVSDITPLSTLSNLRKLYIGVTNVADLAPLRELYELQELYAFGTGVIDLRPLSGLSALTVLVIAETNVSDVQPLSGLTKLQTLNLRSTRVTDISPLANLVALRDLDLEATKVTNVLPLKRLTNLANLNLANTGVSKEQFNQLQLTLSGTKIIEQR